MNITYTGKQEILPPAQQASLETKIGKLAKLLEGNGNSDKQAHVILDHHKSQYKAEITLNYLDHALVGQHVDSDQFSAMNAAFDKLEKQIIKVRDKRRDVKKTAPREEWDSDAAIEQNVNGGPADTTSQKPKVFRVEPAENKPMTLDEALLAIEKDEYFVYLDQASERLSVLLRRADGNFDLVQC